MGGKIGINGVAYDIQPGKTFVNGIAYDIKKGKTLIDSVAYDIKFDSSDIIFLIGDSELRKGTLNGRYESISVENGLVVAPTAAMTGYFNILIDFTNYSNLYIAGYMISTTPFVPSSNNRPKVGYGTNTTDDSFTAQQRVVGYKNGTTLDESLAEIYQFDISNRSGQFYIKGFAQRGGNIEGLYITAIYLT